MGTKSTTIWNNNEFKWHHGTECRPKSWGKPVHKNETTIVLASVTTLVHGIDLCAWPSANACSGIATCCFGVAKNACCSNLIQTVGFSTSYRPLESTVAFTQAWTSSDCGAWPIGTNQVGPGDMVLDWFGSQGQQHSLGQLGDAAMLLPRETSRRPFLPMHSCSATRVLRRLSGSLNIPGPSMP
jgi:hypothetical protein